MIDSAMCRTLVCLQADRRRSCIRTVATNGLTAKDHPACQTNKHDYKGQHAGQAVSVLCAHGWVCCIAGCQYCDDRKSVESLSAASGTWTTLPSTKFERWQHTAVVFTGGLVQG